MWSFFHIFAPKSPNFFPFMLLSLFYFLPCIVSLLWFFSFMLKQKNYRQRLFFYAEGISAIFFAILGIYFFPDTDFDIMVRMEAVCIPFGVLFPAFLISYMYVLCFGRKMSSRLQFLLFVPAIAMGVAISMLSYIMGFDRCAEVSGQFASETGLTGRFDTPLNQLYCFVTYYLFMAILMIYLLTMLLLSLKTLKLHGYQFGDVCRFFFHGKSTYSSRTIAVMYLAEIAIMAMMLALGSTYFRDHVVLGIFSMIAMAAAKHLIAHLEFYSQDNKLVTLHELSHLQLFDEEKTPDVEEEHYESNPTEEKHPSMTAGQVKMDRRTEQFRELMEEKKVWMDEDLTSQSICDMLDIGKSTLSVLISQHYDTTFRNLVNRYRIEEAITYMKANPKATQETVALHCGFKNAQYFNTQFKKYTGETPAMWLASNTELTN